MFFRYFLLSLILHVVALAIRGAFASRIPAPEIAARRGLAAEFSFPASDRGVAPGKSNLAPKNEKKDAQADARSARKASSQDSKTSRSASGKNAARTERGAAGGSSGVQTARVSYRSWRIRYPRLAWEMGKQGEVGVRCRLPSGTTRCARSFLVRSSGYNELDRAALRGLRDYNGFSPHFRDRTLDLTVVFEIPEE